MRICRIAVAGLLCFSLAALAQRGKKKDEEPVTQVLELPPDPPAALTADPARLTFDVAPLTTKGLLSQQVRNQTKWILSKYGRSRIVKIRAFVAGSGDLRRVQSVVADMFSEKRISLPVFSVVQVGALPVNGAQVQMEITAEGPKAVNPNGVAFVAGQIAAGDQGKVKVAALARESMTRLKIALEAAGGGTARRVTCFASNIDNAPEIQQAASSIFPKTPFTLVQAQRAFARPLAECQTVASLTRPPAELVVRINPPRLPAATRYSHVVATNTPRVVLAGAQMAFNFEDADAKLAYERLEKTLASAGSSLKQTLMIDAYPLSGKLAEMVRKYWFEFLNEAAPPASTLMILEGLPSMDAAFALEVVALPAAPVQ